MVTLLCSCQNKSNYLEKKLAAIEKSSKLYSEKISELNLPLVPISEFNESINNLYAYENVLSDFIEKEGNIQTELILGINNYNDYRQPYIDTLLKALTGQHIDKDIIIDYKSMDIQALDSFQVGVRESFLSNSQYGFVLFINNSDDSGRIITELIIPDSVIIPNNEVEALNDVKNEWNYETFRLSFPIINFNKGSRITLIVFNGSNGKTIYHIIDHPENHDDI